MNVPTRSGPLAGFRLVEMDAIGPVPLATMLLADMGAEVVRVARPPQLNAAWDDVGGAVLHRSRTVTHLDLKAPGATEQVLALVERADGLIEGFRPGVMERLGLGPDVCLARNPRLAFVRVTGWGQTGPLALRAGHDLNYIAITGALHAMGDGVAPPPVPLNLVGDYGGGAMFAVTGLLAALLKAQKSGTGDVIDIAMTDGAASLMSLFYAFQSTGLWKDAPASNLLDGAAPFYRCYACADGRHVAVGALEAPFFAQLLNGLGIPAERYSQNDPDDWPAMLRDFAATFATRTRDQWAALFAGTDACVSPVLSMAEAPHDPHNSARGTFVARGGFAQPAPAPRFAASPGSIGEPDQADIGMLIARWSGVAP
ncbi:MAG: carnitine dehydratase [Sphingomonas bacterium]|nr:carnitine dehydratase [Sphingomonas bacterium]